MTVDLVNHPPHYLGHPVLSGECIDYCRHLGFADGNAFKYLWRFTSKDSPVQDLEKTIWYLNECRRHATNVNPLRRGSGMSTRMESEIEEHRKVASSPEDVFDLQWAQILFDIAHAGHDTSEIIVEIGDVPMKYAQVLEGK